MCVCVFVPYRLVDSCELDAEILHRSRLFSNLNDRLYAAARSFKKMFLKIFIFHRIIAIFRQKKIHKPLMRLEILFKLSISHKRTKNSVKFLNYYQFRIWKDIFLILLVVTYFQQENRRWKWTIEFYGILKYLKWYIKFFLKFPLLWS